MKEINSLRRRRRQRGGMLARCILPAALLLGVISCSAPRPSASRSPTVITRSLRDCSQCPTLQIIPPGSFLMGSADGESGHYDSEGPQHRVQIAYRFAIAAEVTTRRQYAAFVAATHRPEPNGCTAMSPVRAWTDDPALSWRDPSYPQGEDDPVSCVSWQDAHAYADWLSQKTGHHYRLPTEAEWEYAARAGTTTAYWWGTQASHEFANYGSEECCNGLAQGRDRWVYTSPASAMPANAFGLRDVAGNIFQWVEDCWHPNFNGAPSDGSAWIQGDCRERAQRGSSWHASARFVRVAYRVSWKPDGRNIYGGFRVARDLN